MAETHRYFKCEAATYTQLAAAVDQSRGYPHGVGTRAVTLRGLPPFDELELANDNSGRGLIAIDKWRFTPSDDEEMLAPAIQAGLIEELTKEEFEQFTFPLTP
jgi:hypothetical protein